MAEIADLYTNKYLAGVQESLAGPSSFFLDRYFTDEIASEAEEVLIDLKEGTRRVAAFCAPWIEGKVIKERGYKTSSFKPAYVKETIKIEPRKSMKRVAGEQIGHLPKTNIERHQMRIMQAIKDLQESLWYRLELMAVEAIRTGKLIISGEDYETQIIDFLRDPSLTIVNTGTSLWSNPASNPIQDIEDAKRQIFRLSGASTKDVILNVDAWDAFWQNPNVQKAFDVRRFTTDNLPVLPTNGIKGVEAKGKLGDLNFFIYNNFYEDPLDGLTKDFIPSGQVVLAGSDIEGMRMFGAILEEEAELKPTVQFIRSFKENRLPHREVEASSAPLMVPTRKNTSASMQVL